MIYYLYSCIGLVNPYSAIMWGMTWTFYTISEINALYNGCPSHILAPEFIHGGVLFMLYNPASFAWAVSPMVASSNLTMYLLFRPEIYIFANYALHKGCLT